MGSSKNLAGSLRTHHCGELRESDIGKTVTLCGWMNKYRNLGSLHFIDLRDKYGITQLGFEAFKGDINELRIFSLESVLMATGKVIARPDSAKNAGMGTGIVEVQVEEIKLLSLAEEVPFLPHGMVQATEDLRLRYRYLDLRSKKLQDILQLRSKTARNVREALYALDFTEVETPILYKTTPEGARDYIVPSRVHPGKVYALPQSPQTLKQLLMIANTDKYFQLCRCFRDEDLRADRQPEFTQVDIEVSFPTQEYMKNLATHVMKHVFSLPDDFEMKDEYEEEYFSHFNYKEGVKKMYISKKHISKERLIIWNWINTSCEYHGVKSFNWNGNSLHIDNEFVGNRVDLVDLISQLSSVPTSQLSPVPTKREKTQFLM